MSAAGDALSVGAGTCGVCGRTAAAHDLVAVEMVHPQVAQRLDAEHPTWRRTGLICRADLDAARRDYIQETLRSERGELTRLDEAVVESIARRETLTSDAHSLYVEQVSFGDRLADRVAVFGGSWTFILSFTGVIVIWMAFNTATLFLTERFDPYPFILLNLALSCVAAMQAPVIMMSQRRQEMKDRLRAENDYRVNLKAELEIRQLHEKLDHLLLRPSGSG